MTAPAVTIFPIRKVVHQLLFGGDARISKTDRTRTARTHAQGHSHARLRLSLAWWVTEHRQMTVPRSGASPDRNFVRMGAGGEAASPPTLPPHSTRQRAPMRRAAVAMATAVRRTHCKVTWRTRGSRGSALLAAAASVNLSAVAAPIYTASW